MPTQSPSSRWHPLRTYQFRLGILPPFAATSGTDVDRYVAGVKRVSGLNVSISSTETREGGNALHRYANPDRATWDPITLEQGLALDDTLERWATAVLHFLTTGTAPAEPVKRNVVIDTWDTGIHGNELERGPGNGPDRRVRRYLVVNAWISKLRALPQLDAMSDEVGLLSVELTHEGWRSNDPAGSAVIP